MRVRTGDLLVWAIAVFFIALVATDASSLDSMDVEAAASFQATADKHFIRSEAPVVNNTEIERYASQLMMIKNGMSLYRDGALNDRQLQTLRLIIEQHVDFGGHAVSSLGPERSRKLAEIVYYHALAASRVMEKAPGSADFRILMERYHTTAGYESYRRAQDYGIDQVWEWQ